jgi:hypothetical protein
MILRIDRLQTQLPPPSDPDPVGAAAVQELLGGKFGEMSTFMNYTYQSFNFRNRQGARPFYDLVASRKPRSIVTLGFGDGQAFFALCQAAWEHDIECQYVALRREDTAEKEVDDVTWLQGKDYGDEFYRDLVRFRNSSNAAMEFADQSLDLLLLDDCDSGAQLRARLGATQHRGQRDHVGQEEDRRVMARRHNDRFRLSHLPAEFQTFIDGNNGVTSAEDQQNFFRIDQAGHRVWVALDAMVEFLMKLGQCHM